MLIIVYVTLYLIYLMKNAIKAEEAKHDKTLFLANVVARYNKSIKKFETRTDISNFSTSSYMTDEEEEDNQSIESMYSTTSSTIDEGEQDNQSVKSMYSSSSTIDEGEQDNQSVKSMYSSSSTIDEDEELDELKFELELEKASNARLISVLRTMPAPAKYDEITARWEEQVIINQDLKFALQKQYRDIYNLKAENEKMKSELEQLQSVISDMKTAKAMYRKINFDLEIERITLDVQKDAIIAKLNTVIDLQLSIDNLLSVGVDRKDAVIKYLKLKIGMVIKRCSVCMQNEISVYFDPCGHSYCSSCLNTSYNCAKCKSVMRIHI